MTLLLFPPSGTAQNTSVTTTLSEDKIKPNEEFTVTFSIDNPVDLYYYSVVIEFDPERVEYVSLDNTGITENGMKVDGISNNRAGVAVSRTDTTESIQNGPFMEVTFRMVSTPEAGQTQLEFLDSDMSDSDGDPIAHDSSPPAEMEVIPGIGRAELTIPEYNAVTEGEPFEVTGRVFASGISEEEENRDRVTAWVGVHSDNSDPQTWDESIWQPLDSDGITEEFLDYRGEVAMFRDVGEWSVAIRTRLDDQTYYYGGLDGFWDGIDSRLANLEIQQQDVFRYELAVWDFEDKSLFPSYSIPENDLAEIQLTNASLGSDGSMDTQTTGGVTYLNTRSWQVDESPDEKYIRIQLETTRFEDLRLSSSHTGTPTSPRFFTVQLSHDGDDWEDLDGGDIELEEGAMVHLQGLEIPGAFEDQDSIFVRWLRVGDERIDENGSGISSTGIHRIGDIRMTGTNIDPRRTEVLPGDINRDGIVNAEDVLYLGHYWLSRGPLPAYDFISFEPREVEEWIPDEATHADTNGDGVVNQKDLLPIGLNFGKTSQPQKQPLNRTPLAGAGIDRLESGEEMIIEFQSEEPESLKGLAYRLTVEGVPDHSWDVDSAQIPEWAERWDGRERLLEFRKKEGSAFEEAFVVKGRHERSDAEALGGLRILAKESWPGPARINLEWVVVSRPDGSFAELEDIQLSVKRAEEVEDPEDQDPLVTELHQNYPNPYHPRTNIRYQLSGEERVRLEVYSITGQRVAILIDSQQIPGDYVVDFDAAHLSSGVYLYRLQAGETLQTRSMLLVK